jgi:hypothetical protein
MDNAGGRGSVRTGRRWDKVGTKPAAECLEIGAIVLVGTHHPGYHLLVAILIGQISHFCMYCCLQIFPHKYRISEKRNDQKAVPQRVHVALVRVVMYSGQLSTHKKVFEMFALFGTEKLRSALKGEGSFGLNWLDVLGRTEVADAHMSVRSKQYVRRLDISVTNVLLRTYEVLRVGQRFHALKQQRPQVIFVKERSATATIQP